MKKYKLTENEQVVSGRTLYQIQALKSFRDVKKGELGGWIEKESNLSQEGDCWVYYNAEVFGDAEVFDNAMVFGDARVSGDAIVSDNAEVFGGAIVYGNARVSGNAAVSGNARVSGNAGDI